MLRGAVNNSQVAGIKFHRTALSVNQRMCWLMLSMLLLPLDGIEGRHLLGPDEMNGPKIEWIAAATTGHTPQEI